MNATKKVYIVRNIDTNLTLYNKVTGLWNDNSKPHLDGRRVWTFAIKKSGLNSPAIQDAIIHLGKLGFKNLRFEEAEVDKVTNELISFGKTEALLAIPEVTGEPLLPAPIIMEAPQETVQEPVAETPKKPAKKASRKSKKQKVAA